MRILRTRVAVVAAACLSVCSVPIYAEDARRIEEIVVTAEKREATVSDTSISITAFGEDMIEDMGLQGPDDLINYIPATTRDAYDIRIRGVGRNFRALGGDPGVATYYNGVYSEDFGIAATENGLYDVARVEVLRGPQGTLYGRNAIGGAMNYINNEPSMAEFEGELRGQFGSFATQEYYGVLSGPIIGDTLGYRFTGVYRDRDGSQDGQGSEDINTIHDQNYSIAFKWAIDDDWTANLRWNDRQSDRIIGQSVYVDEGIYDRRGQPRRDTSIYAYGTRPVADATVPGAIPFTDPLTGGTRYGALIRPGVDAGQFPYTPSGAFNTDALRMNSPDDLDDIESWGISDNTNDEVFDHNAVTFDLTWDLNDVTSLKYIGGYSDFRYTFDLDNDRTPGDLSVYRQTVIEDVYTYSHELQLLWQVGENLQMTSGIYNFVSNRYQDYTLTDAAGQGRITNPVNYGNLAILFGAPAGTPMNLILGNPVQLGDAPVGTSISGVWGGDPEGHVYHHQNEVDNTSYAVFTQGTYTFNENWALTMGVRWAQDEKEAYEDRGGYFEFASFFALPGQTALSTTNIFMGNAFPTGDPNNPIFPLCALDDPNCATPLRLVGIPISYTSIVEDDESWDDVTWRVNMDWTPTPDILVYGSVTTGYRAGGYSLGVASARDGARDPITGLPITGAPLKPLTYDEETVLAYELGYKSIHFDGQLQLFASIYLYDYEGYQDNVDALDPVRRASVNVVQNAGDASNSGFEIEATWLVTDALTIGGNYSYTKTEYEDDYGVLDFQNPAVPTGVFGPILFNPATNQIVNAEYFVKNVKGNDLKRIPEHKGTVWASYDVVFDWGTITANATWAYTGEYFTNPFERSLDKNPDHNNVDVALIWRDSQDRYVVRVFCDNVLDSVGTRSLDAAGEANNYALYGDIYYPRYAGIDLTWRFGAFY